MNDGHRERNKQDVLGSPIVAKAVIKRNGRYEFIIVFAKATRHEFYWIFQARSQRSPRRSWRYAGHQGRDDSPLYYTDFGSFVEHYARLYHAEIMSVRMPKKRRLASLLAAKDLHETIQADWTPQDKSRLSTRMIDERYKRQRLARFPRW